MREPSLHAATRGASNSLTPAGAADDPAALWRTFAPVIAGGGRVRLGVRRAHGRIEYPSVHERDLSPTLPSRPAAVRVYGSDGCCTALCFDLDAKHGHSPADVRRDERYLTQLLAMIGLRWIADLSPSGGRHVYVPLDHRLPIDQAREIVEALARRLPTLDPGPHRSAKTGCIRPPGALHHSGSHQMLSMPLHVAQAAAQRPNTPSELAELRGAIAGDIERAREQIHQADQLVLDLDLPPTDGTLAPISARLLDIARHGRWDGNRYGRDRSAARQAVVTGCVAAQWTFGDIWKRLGDGTWPGLAAMYAKYPAGTQRANALRRDIESARAYLASNKTPARPGEPLVRISNTSAKLSRRGVAERDEHAYIRTWRGVLATFETTRLAGRRFYAARFLLRALGEAAHKAGSRQISFGCRSLAEATGVDFSTVSVLLRELSDLGWVRRVARGWGENADTWELTIPTALLDELTDIRWPRGKIHALRPAFRALGPVSALVFEAVETNEAHSVLDLSRHLRMARSSVHESVDLLLSWSLLERDGDKRLRAYPSRLARVAEYLGVDEEVHAQMAKHRRQRALWRAWLARFDSNEYIDAADLREAFDDSPTLGFEIEAL